MLQRLESEEQDNQMDENVPQVVQSSSLFKVVRKGHKKNEKKQSPIFRRKQKPRASSDNFNLNQIQFSEKGFNPDKTKESLRKIEQLFEETKKFAQMPDAHLGGFHWAQLCREISSFSTENLYLIQKENSYYLVSENGLTKITRDDALIWETVSDIIQKMKEGVSGPGLSGMIKEQLQQGQRIIAETQQSIQNVKCQQYLNQEMDKLCQEYWKIIALKTFKQSFNIEEIDEMNYFRFKEYQEGHSLTYKPIKNQQQWKQYIGKRRNKLRKSELHILHVACQNCMSPYFQPTNQIIACPQCHTRYHELCLDLSQVKRCGRCIYSRLSSQSKQSVPQCFLCGVTGLGTTKITSTKFAHIFCLLVHKMWSISGKKIQPIKTSLPPPSRSPCAICHKSTGYFSQCKRCLKYIHPLCAFLNGHQIKFNLNQDFQVICCVQSEQERQKLQKTRKFILNFDRCVFLRLDKTKQKKKRQKLGDESD